MMNVEFSGVNPGYIICESQLFFSYLHHRRQVTYITLELRLFRELSPDSLHTESLISAVDNFYKF